MSLKINILYPFKVGPYGGANQFLKALKVAFEASGNYTDSIKNADVILFNASPVAYKHLVTKCLNIKRKYPNKYFFMRMDGPIHISRKNDFHYDEAFYLFDNLMADGTIFQSNWSKNNCLNTGMSLNKNNKVILNGVNPNIFYKKTKESAKKKLKIIASSWSNNFRKGFMVYKWLDANLDFEQYQMTFIGNSPIPFQNISHQPPIHSSKLADVLRENHIYLTASMNDPCSNALIEALSCGLPALAFKDGGHPEILKTGGELFVDKDEIIPLLEKIKENYRFYSNQIPDYSIEIAANKYFTFFHDTVNNYSPKNLNSLNRARLLSNLINIWFQDDVRKRIKYHINRIKPSKTP